MSTALSPRPWDSDFFGSSVFEAHLSRGGFDRVVAGAIREGADCLYIFAEAADLDSIGTAVRRGARLVDLRVELAGELLPTEQDSQPTSRATDRDRETLLPQATELARESRFARDPRIPQHLVDAMYEIWLDRCLREGVVTIPASRGLGFVGARDDGDEARIELVYVDPSSRGLGLGAALIRSAAAAFGEAEVCVVTQTGNVAAQRLYQSLGLRNRSSLAVLHLWLDELSA
jgi:ribosomal protein S18 acetylase RimI-like enzyme